MFYDALLYFFATSTFLRKKQYNIHYLQTKCSHDAIVILLLNIEC